jgi:hypothetical protein
MLLWVFVLGVGAKINYKIRCCKQPAWPPLDTSTDPSRLFRCNPLHKRKQHSTARFNSIQPVTKSLDTQTTAQDISIIYVNTTSIKCPQHCVEFVYFWFRYIFLRLFFSKISFSPGYRHLKLLPLACNNIIFKYCFHLTEITIGFDYKPVI